MVIHPDRSVELVVDRTPLARLAELVVGRIPPARLVALADDATASGCCASRDRFFSVTHHQPGAGAFSTAEPWFLLLGPAGVQTVGAADQRAHPPGESRKTKK